MMRFGGIEGVYAAAWHQLRDLVRLNLPTAAAVACVPGIAVLPLIAAPTISEYAILGALAYLGSAAFALSWYLRACLGVLHPDAPGARVALLHYVWRVALAWAMPLAPAIWIFMLVETGLTEDSGWAVAMILPSVGLIFVMFALAALASARVAATGRFSPLESWALLRGRRLTSIYSLGLVLVVALGAGGFLFLPSVGLEAIGLPWWSALLPGTVLAHGVMLPCLAAVATAVHDQAAG